MQKQRPDRIETPRNRAGQTRIENNTDKSRIGPFMNYYHEPPSV